MKSAEKYATQVKLFYEEVTPFLVDLHAFYGITHQRRAAIVVKFEFYGHVCVCGDVTQMGDSQTLQGFKVRYLYFFVRCFYIKGVCDWFS